jgi:hypothetical protein
MVIAVNSEVGSQDRKKASGTESSNPVATLAQILILDPFSRE